MNFVQKRRLHVIAKNVLTSNYWMKKGDRKF